MPLSATDRKKIQIKIFNKAKKKWPGENPTTLRDIARLEGLEDEDTFSSALNNQRFKKAKQATAEFLEEDPAKLFPNLNWSKD